MGLRIVHVNAFTDRPFAGNPAAVCLLPAPAGDTWMQALAQELNVSETAFLVRRDGEFNLRWFTPTVEVDLCGHATLASAHVLWEEGHLPTATEARFHTKSGLLTATREGAAIELDFPAEVPRAATLPDDLVAAVGVPVRWAGRNRMDWLIEVADEATVRAVRPVLARLPSRGVIITARAQDPGYDFVSRFFAPAAGVDEDPVTGSAHCALAPFWAERLDKRDMLGYQASARGGEVRVRLTGDRVRLGGRAVTVLAGELAPVAHEGR